ncbi:MAG TPA: insulinase family protein [Syntrophobacteraceae bacterium]|nr:insulinase family protein [Syntrophobacteraceae bacterium]
MKSIHGFRLEREAEIPEINTTASFYRHEKTGAELLSLSNEDENKVFGITFRTPPGDSTGVAHILEHAVLCGSRKYPVKEPFVELLKGSLKTFLNAFTYPDKTCYPVASQNVQDFYNLIDVYLDAVFYPRISLPIFQQEGWHYELEGPNAPLSFKGVVFNEMKGAYSSPDNLLAERTQQSLFPSTPYGLDSGGDPAQIPSLTYEQFRRFHRKHYHPSNARIFFYGDDDPDRRLRILDEYLRDFEQAEVDSRVDLQPRFSSPRRVEHLYAAGSWGDGEESGTMKGMVTVNWLLAETADPELNLTFQVLHYALLGMPGSPLRKSLIESGLGDDLAGVGLETELRQMYFSTGLKGVPTADLDRVEPLVLETLERLCRETIHSDTIEAGINTIEFRLRENNTGAFPRGLSWMLRSLTTWLYGEDPLKLLAFEAPLTSLKSRIASTPRFFEEMIRLHFLENPHRTTVVLRPDPDLLRRMEAEEQERLAAFRRSAAPEQILEVIRATAELRRLQETPDPPEALSTIPSLRLSDLDKKNKRIPCESAEKNGLPLLLHDLFTSGIVYLDLGFNLKLLPRESVPLVPLFARALLEMGTDREDYVSLTQRISRKTGGIRPELFSSIRRREGKSATWLFLRGKAMSGQLRDLFEILGDVLSRPKLDDRERFRQMVLEEKARQEHRMVPNGHQMVNLRLRSRFNEADWASEQMNGVSYLLFLRDLARRMDTDWPGILAQLESLRQVLVRRDSMVLNVTTDQAGWSVTDPLVGEFASRLPTGSTPETVWQPDPPEGHEGMIVPSQVNYVGKGLNVYADGIPFHGSFSVVTGYLRTSWLWERVRVQGGAYGAFCMFDRHTGSLTLVSYRDPNLSKTLDSYDQAADFLKKLDLSESELTKAIIGAIGTLDAHMLPDAKGFTSLLRTLIQDDEQERQVMRDQILATRASDFRAFAEVIEGVKARGTVGIMGPQAAMAEAARSLGDSLRVWKLL